MDIQNIEEKKDFPLTLVVDGRKYPITIKKSEEEAFRSAAKTIDNKSI